MAVTLMKSYEDDPASDEALCGALRVAVGNALERKRRLGQYAVVWRDGGPVRLGIDVPWSDDTALRSGQDADAKG
jgi:hypothetical protein